MGYQRRVHGTLAASLIDKMSGNQSDFIAMQAFMVQPVDSWSTEQILMFPWLFIVPAEILGLISSAIIFALGSKDNDLPHGPMTGVPLSWTSWFYVIFNRLVMLPFISFLIVRTVWASNAVVYPKGDDSNLNIYNGLGAFAVVFALSDFVYYAGHRIVHSYPKLYIWVHKHHHGEAEPIRGWADTCNAHPMDFFYTGFSTSPMSVLWLMPAGTVHIYAIAASTSASSSSTPASTPATTPTPSATLPRTSNCGTAFSAPTATTGRSRRPSTGRRRTWTPRTPTTTTSPTRWPKLKLSPMSH